MGINHSNPFSGKRDEGTLFAKGSLFLPLIPPTLMRVGRKEPIVIKSGDFGCFKEMRKAMKTVTNRLQHSRKAPQSKALQRHRG
jgi:hypothetical protein